MVGNLDNLVLFISKEIGREIGGNDDHCDRGEFYEIKWFFGKTMIWEALPNRRKLFEINKI